MSEEIFMIHGMFCKGSSWDNYRRFFEQRGYHCITPTLRFHDITPKDNPDPQLGTTSLLDYINDLQKEIENLNQAPIIMGHSMGGLLAQILGSRGLGKALVVLNSAPSRGSTTFNPLTMISMMKAWGSVLFRPGYSSKPFRLSYAVFSRTASQPFSEKERTDEYAKLVYESGKALQEIISRKPTTAVDESVVRVPVLMISGKLDSLISNGAIRNMAKKYGEWCTYKDFEDQSHWVISGPRWEEVASYVSDWLDQKLLRPK
jgi:pimeloyl-ACP methyl ester carboxylesterase